ncbi:MAG: formylglycine-generating enzyme family protein, partial [Gemmataceae bacterium]
PTERPENAAVLARRIQDLMDADSSPKQAESAPALPSTPKPPAVATSPAERPKSDIGVPSAPTPGNSLSLDIPNLLRDIFTGAPSCHLHPDLPARKLQNVQRKYASFLKPQERILLIYDGTMFGSAKDGFILTDHGVGWAETFGSPKYCTYSDLIFDDVQSVSGGISFVAGQLPAYIFPNQLVQIHSRVKTFLGRIRPETTPKSTSSSSASKKTRPPIELKITKSQSVLFAWVPPGQSWLGGGGGKPGEKAFTLAKGLWCGIYPVTQGQWQALMGKNPSYFHFKNDPNLPVEQVSWNMAQNFLKKLNKKSSSLGYSFRLPTVEEWEYICRGGPISKEESAFDFTFVKSKKDLTPVRTNDLSSQQANFRGIWPAGSAGQGPDSTGTTPVGSYRPNPLGIYDMHGNVREWTSSFSWMGEKEGYRMVCGGCWASNGDQIKAGNPSWYGADEVFNTNGLRLIAESLEEESSVALD